MAPHRSSNLQGSLNRGNPINNSFSKVLASNRFHVLSDSDSDIKDFEGSINNSKISISKSCDGQSSSAKNKFKSDPPKSLLDKPFNYASRIDSDIMLLIDSNGRFIQPATLSDKSCRKIIYPKFENAIEIITDSHCVRDPEVLICHKGTNNLDFSDPYSVADLIIDFANIAKEKFPGSKVAHLQYPPQR